MFESDYRLSIPSILSPSETSDVAEKILNAADGVIAAEPAALERKQFVSLQELNDVLALALGERQTEDPQKEAKEAADRKRDTGFVRVKNTVNDVLDDEEEEDQALKDAAAVVKQVLADYPANVHRTKLAENTILLNTLIPKLRAEPAASAIATLGLTRYVDRMEEGNEEYKQASEASAAGRAEEIPQDWVAARSVRWHGAQFASNLAYLGETDAAFAPLAAQVRQFIADAEAVARARQSRRQNDDDNPPEPSETPGA